MADWQRDDSIEAGSSSHSDELGELLHAMSDGRLDDADRARLGEMLRGSETACLRYIEFVDFHVSLTHLSASLERESRDRSSSDNGQSSPPGRLPLAWPDDFAPFASEAAPPQRPGETSEAFRSVKFVDRAGALWQAMVASTERRTWLVAAAAVLLIAFVSQWLHRGQRGQAPDENAQAKVESSVPAEVGSDDDASMYVARVVRVSPDVTWGVASASLDFFLRVRPDDKLHVTSGLAELEFYSGAKIILHGPSVFMATGPASGRLISGRLTGDVADGNFRLTTPAADVIDLGTEFGVCADDTTGTDVYVFDGEVKVISRTDNDQVLNMSQGMATRIRMDGTAEYNLRAKPGEFTRSLTWQDEASSDDVLSLVDILSGGNGLGTRLAGAVDPTTGKLDRGDWYTGQGAGRRTGNGAFHAVDWHPLIDGLFVPPKEGKQVQLDSAGHTVDLPAVDVPQVNASGYVMTLKPRQGMTWGPVWARRRTNEVGDQQSAKDFWGTSTLNGILVRLNAADIGIVGIHPNAGVTFDLRAVRFEQRRSVAQFRAKLANLDMSRELMPDWFKSNGPSVANFHVFVDGQMRYSRLEFGRDDGEAEVAVHLTPQDRFLTLVSTDCNGQISFDHIVLIDPVLVMESE